MKPKVYLQERLNTLSSKRALAVSVPFRVMFIVLCCNNWVRSLYGSHHERCWHFADTTLPPELTLNADNNTVPASATDGAASHCQLQGKAEVSLEAVSLLVTNQYDGDLSMDGSMSCVSEWRISQLCDVASMGPVASTSGALALVSVQVITLTSVSTGWLMTRSWKYYSMLTSYTVTNTLPHGVNSDKYFAIIANGLSRKQLRMLFVISQLWSEPW